MSEEIKSEIKSEEPDLKKQKKLKQLSDARLKKQKVKAEREQHLRSLEEKVQSLQKNVIPEIRNCSSEVSEIPEVSEEVSEVSEVSEVCCLIKYLFEM